MIYYYGCVGGTGHRLIDEQGQSPRFREPDGSGTTCRWERVIPWGLNLDGGLPPRLPSGAQAPNGVAAWHMARAVDAFGTRSWSAISFWDNTVDHRGGSSSTFLVPEEITAHSLLVSAQLTYPEIFARFARHQLEIVLA